jgi:signal recognition particle GTPase
MLLHLYYSYDILIVTATRNKMSKRLQDLSKSTSQAVDKRDTLRIEQALITAETKLGTVRSIIETLHSDSRFDHLSDLLSKVVLLSDDVTGPAYHN